MNSILIVILIKYSSAILADPINANGYQTADRAHHGAWKKLEEVPDLTPAVPTVRNTGPEHHLKTEQENRLTEQEKIVVAYREEIRQ